MKITEVRIFPTESKDGKLKAFATMTFDDWFVVRNIKVIQGNSGLFVAMPSRKAMDSCPKCRTKNVVGSKYCNQCGSDLPPQRTDEQQDTQGNHMDIAHPITQECRVYIQEKILEAYNREKGAPAQEMAVKADPVPVEKASAPVQEPIPESPAPAKKEESGIGASGIEEANDIEL
ncbi:MAG: septation protein SpoVG family protein [Candidatus Omnitrophica bacterium]|nr:septation protein SpoVG family protein [Candidatus Omnitrophota bacterium]MDD5488194.1 septation protein SpoVG family protein [Candidatus Omnitrophota bacterium]